MNFDMFVVAGFLLVNLGIGLYYGRGVRNIRDYALGGRNFSTAVLTATIVATWISGSFFAITISEAYKDGIWFVIAGSGDIISILIIAYILGPRMANFLGSLSIAETMGVLFGNYARIITAVVSIIKSVGYTAVQIKIFSMLFSHFLQIDSTYTTIISAAIVIVYSSFGGVRSVTFTDVIQFATFGVFIPICALFIWKILGNEELIQKVVEQGANFDYRQLGNLDNPKFWTYLFLFVYFAVPQLNPTMFQRMLMGRDTNQIKKSFLFAAFIIFFIHLISCFIGFVIYSYDATLNPDSILFKIIDDYFSSGLRGIALISIMAMIMSTTDSWINSGSVIFAHDLCKSIKNNIKNELLVSRIFSVFFGVAALTLALSVNSIFELVLLTSNFYMPVVIPVLILSILGFRSTQRAYLISVASAAIVIISWKYLIDSKIDSVVPAMIANLVAFLSAHYILREPGGWVAATLPNLSGTDTSDQDANPRSFFNTIFFKISNFKLLEYCDTKKPKNEVGYYYSAFSVFSLMIMTLSISESVYLEHTYLINVLQTIALGFSTIFLCHQLWPHSFREKYIGVVWCVSMCLCLSVISSLLVFLSGFSHLSVMIFTFHLVMLSLLISWQASLIIIILGIAFSWTVYLYFIDTSFLVFSYSPNLKIAYSVFIFSSFILTIIKPKQEYVEATEHKLDKLEIEVNDLDETVVHYSQRVADQALEIERLGSTAQRILNNVNHELRLPVGNVMNFAEMLSGGLEKYSKDQLKELSNEVLKNSNRLSTMILNMLDLSMLSTSKIELKKKTVNLSELVEDRVNNCRKVYLQGKKIDFQMSIESDILMALDPDYIRQTVDNLVINAISYSKNGTIKVSLLRKDKDIVEFEIKDEGIGIAKTELFDIFTPFKMGIKTESKAEGRGVGLALCKSAIEAHGGTIKVESNGTVGATFRFMLFVK